MRKTRNENWRKEFRMNVKMYGTNHCPKCKVLEQKLNTNKVQYEHITDEELMISMGFKSVPVLEVDGVRMNFAEANEWIKERD